MQHRLSAGAGAAGGHVPDDRGGRSRMLSTKEGFVEILEFTHFARVFRFNRTPEIGKKKEISHGIKVSVVMELV